MDNENRLLPLSDEQWAQIENAFPQRRGRSGFERKISNRQAFEAGLHRARVGCPWRDLPAAYGEDHTIYRRWRRWVKGSVPQRALVAAWCLETAKRGELDLSLAMIDSTAVRAHQHAAGARKKRRPGPWSLAGRVEHENPRRQRQ